MAPRRSRLERMTNLVLALLETERPMPLREIGAAVAGYPPNHAALRQAFERDKASLREAGIPVQTLRIDGEDQAGYLISRNEYYLPDLGLEPKEAEALAFALAAVRLEGGAIGDIAAKLGSPGVPTLAPIAVLPSLPVLGTLEEALRSRSIVRFIYHDRDREVAGYGLVFKAGSWYFIGNDLSVGDGGSIRTFRADRIPAAVVSDEIGAYEIPSDFSASGELLRRPLATTGSTETTEVVVKVWPSSAPAVIGAVGAAAVEHRDSDGGVTLRFHVADEHAIRSYLLGFGDDVEVLAPAELRDTIIAELRAVAGLAAQVASQ
jgi:proteasome accessory factor B